MFHIAERTHLHGKWV